MSEELSQVTFISTVGPAFVYSPLLANIKQNVHAYVHVQRYKHAG